MDRRCPTVSWQSRPRLWWFPRMSRSRIRLSFARSVHRRRAWTSRSRRQARRSSAWTRALPTPAWPSSPVHRSLGVCCARSIRRPPWRSRVSTRWWRWPPGLPSWPTVTGPRKRAVTPSASSGTRARVARWTTRRSPGGSGRRCRPAARPRAMTAMWTSPWPMRASP